MKRFIVYSDVNAATISTSMGKPEYSYYFVLKEFLPMLQKLGEVIVIENPAESVDTLYSQSKAAGIDCIFLSFSPPHKTTLGLRCPTIPVFAWEFDSLPSELWLNDPHSNWQYGLSRCGRAIVHSELTRQATIKLMGSEFPVVSIPAPLWERMEPTRNAGNHAGECVTVTLQRGVIIDTRTLSLEAYRPGPDAMARFLEASQPAASRTSSATREESSSPTPNNTESQKQSFAMITLRYLVEWYRLVWRDLLFGKPSTVCLPTPIAETVGTQTVPSEARSFDDPFAFKPHTLSLDGVIFTAVFNPYDGRKNWEDMLTSFCTAFRDKDDATLLFKLTHQEYRSAMEAMLMCMGRLPPFKCRVVLLQGFLEQSDYQSLMAATAYIVNASHGEGQCLPLMEYMSCGKPAIAPRNSAMLDYMDNEVGFVVNSWLDATAWPHDPRLAYRTCRHQIDWASLVTAYQDAYQCFRESPKTYQQLSVNAITRMQRHCSIVVAIEKLERLLNMNEYNNALSA